MSNTTATGTNTEQDGILNKIRNLLAKAESTEHPAEAEAFTAKAVELMSKYAVDEATVRAATGEKVVIINKKIEIFGPYVTQKMSLFNIICARTRCQLVNIGRTANGTERPSTQTSKFVHVFGRESDVRFVELLFSSLLVQQAIEINNTPVPYWENAKTFRTSFMQGYATIIGNRLSVINAATAKEVETSTALVLVNDKKAASQAMADEYPNTQTVTRRQSVGSRSGYAQGNEAASKADIGQSNLSGRKQLS